MQTAISAHRPDFLALPRFVTVRELAARIARNEFTVYHWLKKAPERLPRITRVHGRVLFLEADVRAWFDSQRGDEIAAATKRCEPPQRQRGRPTKAEQVRRRTKPQVAASAQ